MAKNNNNNFTTAIIQIYLGHTPKNYRLQTDNSLNFIYLKESPIS